jgi:hypothetical protein
VVDNRGQAELPNDLTLVDVVRMAAEKAAGDGLFEAPIEGDFPLADVRTPA